MKNLNDMNNAEFNNIREVCEFLSVDSKGVKDVVNTLISEESDLEVLKAAAIKFDDKFDFLFINLQDRLVEIMGDDAYDFMDENELA